jgi:hypothetical protein
MRIENLLISRILLDQRKLGEVTNLKNTTELLDIEIHD